MARKIFLEFFKVHLLKAVLCLGFLEVSIGFACNILTKQIYVRPSPPVGRFPADASFRSRK